jgi:hypothetical protein
VERLHRAGQERRGGASVLGLRAPRPPGQLGGAEPLPVALEDRLRYTSSR